MVNLRKTKVFSNVFAFSGLLNGMIANVRGFVPLWNNAAQPLNPFMKNILSVCKIIN
jgi:hypothetical protein